MTTLVLLWRYTELYFTAAPNPVFDGRVASVARRIAANMARYRTVENETGVPAHLVAALHNMEASGDFGKNLANGEPIGRRTTLVPAGLGPWSSFEASAIDILTRKLDSWRIGFDTIAHQLAFAERYNGLGYLLWRQDVPSPYLWSGTRHYTRGKYVADGRWDSNAVSAQVGVAATIARLVADGVVRPQPPIVPAPFGGYEVARLQRWMGDLKTDGDAGRLTRARYRTLYGSDWPIEP